MLTVTTRRISDTEADLLVRGTPPDRPPIEAPHDGYTLMDEDSGHVIAVSIPAPPDLAAACTAAFRAVPRSNVVRAAGVASRSNTYGWAAPNSMLQRPAPSKTTWAREHPALHEPLADFSTYAWDALTSLGYAPDAVALKGRVHPAYRLGESGWTSGIGNDTVPLHYHHDHNNHPASWSAMLCCRAGTDGGNLHITEYDTVLPIRDKSILLFPGVKTVHGVTPIKRRFRGGFRYTFVSYTVRALVDALGPAEAAAAAAARRTELEANLIARQRAEGLLD